MTTTTHVTLKPKECIFYRKVLYDKLIIHAFEPEEFGLLVARISGSSKQNFLLVVVVVDK